MKRVLLAAFVAMLCGTAVAAEPYGFDHGPYLQGLTDSGVKVFFTTSSEGFSWVEARRKGSDAAPRRFVGEHDGLVDAFTTSNAIALTGLEPATEYEYRLVSKRMDGFQPYRVTYGDSIVSQWYSFSTLDPDARRFSFMAVSDIHDDAGKLRRLVSHMPADSVDMVFMIGDIMSYFTRPDQPYASFIDPAVEMFATEKPFVVVRGNHETRGHLARTYRNYISMPEGSVPGGNFYGFFRVGDAAIVMIDSGEDKPDGHPVYAGIVSFDEYRRRQADWLREVVRSREFRSARHRIVMMHIPPVDGRDGEAAGAEGYAPQQVYDLFVPILDKAGIDLMICGHTHRRMFFEYGFPVVVNDNKSASKVDVSPAGIHVRAVNVDGEVVFDRMFR